MTERNEESTREGLKAVAGVIAGVFERRRRDTYELGLRYIDLLVDEHQYKPDMP